MLKYKIYVLFLFLIGICSINIVYAQTLPLIGKVIYIDPGHGGVDPGAIYRDTKEKDINLKISKYLTTELEKAGATVFLTRYDDYDLAVPNAISRKKSDLSRRGNIINESNANLYVSIHLNADINTTYKGAQIFYDDVNPVNKKIALEFEKIFKQELKTTREYKKLGNIYMYQRINIPGILIEAGFLTNPNECFLLKTEDYQNKIAKTIYKGIVEILK